MRRAGAYVILAGFLLFNILTISNLLGDRALAKPRFEVNIFEPGSAYDISLLQNLETQLGFKFIAANWYLDWGTAFDSTASNTYKSSGHIPELIWEPQINGAGVAYTDVASGVYDTYITQTATAVKQLGYPIRISLAPEMNTDWTPWGIGKQGNTASSHITFWRHVVQKFRDVGATNVSWIWSPNVQPWNAQQLYGSYAQIFPGDAYVDFIGLDGYNWGTSQSWSEWQSFDQIFSSSYNEITKASSKNLLIMEIASTEQGGSKAAWISNIFAVLKNGYARVQGFSWFDINKETDWRIISSVSAKQAFINGYNDLGSTPTASPTTVTKPAIQPKSLVTTPEANTTTSTATVVPNPVTTVTTDPTQPKASAVTGMPQKLAGVYVAGEQTTTPSTMSITSNIGLAVLVDVLLLLSIWLASCHSASSTRRDRQRKKKHNIDGLANHSTT